MWAQRRKWVIISILAAVAVTVIAVTLIATLYHAPSCMDKTQNQGEQGVDCGGPCPYLCTASELPPSVEFVRPLSPVPGRTDVIAYIDNKNADAAVKGASFTITLYGPDNIVVASKKGTVDLPPKSRVPVFVPDFYSGFQPVAQAFLTFNDASFKWYNDTALPPVLPVSDITLTGSDAPRITANIANPTATVLRSVPVVVTVFDASDNAIAASETVLDQIPPMDSALAIFTWNQAFPSAPTREEVLPLAPF